MAKMIDGRPKVVIGPLGESLSDETLPLPGTSRWVARRKAQVAAAVDGGLLTPREACDRYDLTFEELASWLRAFEHEGLKGLRVRRTQFNGSHKLKRRKIDGR